MTAPDISLIVPVHSLDFFHSTWNSLKSVMSRKIELEILIVLDRVSIKEIEKIVSLSSPNVQIIESKGPGIVPTLNTGLSIAKGRYIARIDDDDVILSRRLIKQMRYLDKHSKCMAVGSSLVLIDEKNSWVGTTYYPTRINKIGNNIFKHNPIAHPSVMYRRLEVIEIGGYRDNFAEDWDLWIRLLSKGYLKNTLQPFTAYRIHPNQLSRDTMYRTEIAGTRLAEEFHSSIIEQQRMNDKKNRFKASKIEYQLDFELQEILHYYQLFHVPKKDLIRTVHGFRFLLTMLLRKVSFKSANLLLSTVYFIYIRKQLKRAVI